MKQDKFFTLRTQDEATGQVINESQVEIAEYDTLIMYVDSTQATMEAAKKAHDTVTKMLKSRHKVITLPKPLVAGFQVLRQTPNKG